jgi:hypothetical protein
LLGDQRQTISMMFSNWLKPRSLAALALGGCDLLQDSNPHPWIGYAYNKDHGQFEWEWNDWATERDCRESMLRIVETRSGMTKPVGCGYRGNNYWRVWIINELWGGSQIDCIARKTKVTATRRSQRPPSRANSRARVSCPRRPATVSRPQAK